MYARIIKTLQKVLLVGTCSIMLCSLPVSVHAAPTLSPEELKEFSKRLTTKDPVAIYAVVQDINKRNIAHPLLINGLRRFLNDKTIDHKIFIAETLAKLGASDGFTYLETILKDPGQPLYQKVAAIKALGNTQSSRAVTILEALSGSLPAELHLQCTYALIQLGKKVAPQDILSLYATLSTAKKCQLLALFKGQAATYQALYDRALRDSDPFVVSYCVDILLTLADFNGLDTIEAALPEMKTNDDTLIRLDILFNHDKGLPFSHLGALYDKRSPYGRELCINSLKRYMKTYPETVLSAISFLSKKESSPSLLFELNGLKKEVEDLLDEKQAKNAIHS